jgi:hypothetical protein
VPCFLYLILGKYFCLRKERAYFGDYLKIFVCTSDFKDLITHTLAFIYGEETEEEKKTAGGGDNFFEDARGYTLTLVISKMERP